METHQFNTGNGSYRVHVTRRGGSPRTSMFLHGGPGLNTAAERSLFAPAMDPDAGFIWVDLLGCGESRAASPDHLSWDAQVDDVAEIGRAFGDGPVHFVGHSIGADVIHDMVRRHRDVVGSAVWISPAADVAEVLQSVIGRAATEGHLNRTKLTLEQQHALDRFLGVPPSMFGRGEVLIFLEMAALMPNVWTLYFTDAAVQLAYLHVMQTAPLSPDAFVGLLSSYFASGTREIPDYTGIPVQILYSHEDPVTPWDRHGAAASRAVPHAAIHQIDGGGHFVHLQRPQPAADAIGRFLSGLTA